MDWSAFVYIIVLNCLIYVLLQINLKKELLNAVGGRITEISSNVDGADLELKSLMEEADKLTEKSQAFQENATLLRVADVQVIAIQFNFVWKWNSYSCCTFHISICFSSAFERALKSFFVLKIMGWGTYYSCYCYFWCIFYYICNCHSLVILFEKVRAVRTGEIEMIKNC